MSEKRHVHRRDFKSRRTFIRLPGEIRMTAHDEWRRNLQLRRDSPRDYQAMTFGRTGGEDSATESELSKTSAGSTGEPSEWTVGSDQRAAQK